MENMVKLDAIQPGCSAVVNALGGDAALKKRMTEMGLTKGAIVHVERIAPLGDPMDIKIRGYHLSMRKDEAALISVTPTP